MRISVESGNIYRVIFLKLSFKSSVKDSKFRPTSLSTRATPPTIAPTVEPCANASIGLNRGRIGSRWKIQISRIRADSDGKKSKLEFHTNRENSPHNCRPALFGTLPTSPLASALDRGKSHNEMGPRCPQPTQTHTRGRAAEDAPGGLLRIANRSARFARGALRFPAGRGDTREGPRRATNARAERQSAAQEK